MASAVNFAKKSVVFVTGGSRGIGRTIAVEISRKLEQHSIIILIAQSQKGLDETKAQIIEVDKSLNVLTHSMDLSKPDFDDFCKFFQSVVDSIDCKDIEYGIFFHNAGSTGLLQQTTDLTDLEQWQKYYNVNLFSTNLLNSAFIKYIRPIAPQLVTINITSLCGRAPFINMAQYGSGKAARDLLFKVLAKEQPRLIVLNYSPGPVDTDMFNDVVREAQSVEVRKQFEEVKNTSILTPVQTVSKLLDILEKGNFNSGDTIDYFDVA